jgi:hypothetical protein
MSGEQAKSNTGTLPAPYHKKSLEQRIADLEAEVRKLRSQMDHVMPPKGAMS